MRKVISTIVVTGLVSSMLVSTAFAGNRHLEVLNPLWLPVAIFSTIAAVTVASIPQPPVVYERREYYEPRQRVIYEEPRPTVVYKEQRHYRNDHHYDRRTVDCRYDKREHAYEGQRYREYR